MVEALLGVVEHVGRRRFRGGGVSVSRGGIVSTHTLNCSISLAMVSRLTRAAARGDVSEAPSGTHR